MASNDTTGVPEKRITDDSQLAQAGEKSDKPAEPNSIIFPSARKAASLHEDEPLVDTTASLPLRSKKTERLQKRLDKKNRKVASATRLLDLPPELLSHVLESLQPTDLFRLTRVSKALQSFIKTNNSSLARSIIQRDYHVLSRTFPRPFPLFCVPTTAHPGLLSPRRQEMISIHKKPYSHVPPIDPYSICTCMTCVFAWNNLALILDLAHWQPQLDRREPLPVIPRGTAPEWNADLLDSHARIVQDAMVFPLTYAAMLQTHLRTTIATLLRTVRGKKTVHPRRLYHFTPADASTKTDAFLERPGPPSYEFPWMRDCYYGLEAYVPNRKWVRDKERWGYYGEGLHERDVGYVVEMFTPEDEKQKGLVERFWSGGGAAMPSQ